MEFINATLKDISEIVALEKSTFTTDAWNEEQWRYDIEENKFSFIYLLKDNQKLVGYIDFWILFDQATISKICVDPSYRKLGLGDKILKEALKKIDEENCIVTTLEVRVSNTSAYNLYLKNKFKQTLIKKNYYDDGEDCFYMIRSIGDVYE